LRPIELRVRSGAVRYVRRAGKTICRGVYIHKPAPRCPGCRELSTRRAIFARWILRLSQHALSESAAPRRPVAGISVLSCVKCPLPQDRSPSLDLRFREKRLAGRPAPLRRAQTLKSPPNRAFYRFSLRASYTSSGTDGSGSQQKGTLAEPVV
jgi:hypothetical protein